MTGKRRKIPKARYLIQITSEERGLLCAHAEPPGIFDEYLSQCYEPGLLVTLELNAEDVVEFLRLVEETGRHAQCIEVGDRLLQVSERLESGMAGTVRHRQRITKHHSHHEIDYIEIEVTDMAQSKRFYEAAFDWQFNDYGPSYSGIQKRQGGEAGGLRLQPDVSPGGPLVILYSDDLDSTLRGVREAGGKIAKAPFDFPGGRRFHFQDPSGNELAVWSAQ